jgi:hypothetical protein
MGVARQFWLFIIPLLVGLSATGLLFMASFFPDQLFDVGSQAYILTAVVGAAAFGLVIWESTVFSMRSVTGQDPPRNN